MSLGFKSRRSGAFRSVFLYCWAHWKHQPGRASFMLFTAMLSTLADVLTPLFSGRLVDAVVSGPASDAANWNDAFNAFCWLMALSVGAVILRHATFTVIIRFTLKSMSEIAANSFFHIQRFSSDWHANSFAGSTVRKVTRGMWALDLLNDTILMALLPSFIVLVGSMILLGIYLAGSALLKIHG